MSLLQNHTSLCFFTAPSAPPENITILNTTLFTITVGWDEVPCIHRNGNITEYRIMYNAQDSIVVYDFSVSGTSARISDLQSDTEYNISVAAMNTAGVSSYRTISGKTQTCKLNAYAGTCIILFVYS